MIDPTQFTLMLDLHMRKHLKQPDAHALDIASAIIDTHSGDVPKLAEIDHGYRKEYEYGRNCADYQRGYMRAVFRWYGWPDHWQVPI